MADIEGLQRRLQLDPGDVEAALALVQALRRHGEAALARQAALEAAARAADDLGEAAQAVRRALWGLPWAGDSARRPWLCVLRAPLGRERLSEAAYGVALPARGGGPRVGLWRPRDGATALDLVSGEAQAERPHPDLLPGRAAPERALRRGAWGPLAQAMRDHLNDAAVSPDLSRAAALHRHHGLLVYGEGAPPPAQAARAVPDSATLHMPNHFWLSGLAKLSSDATAALALDPWSERGVQRWYRADLCAGQTAHFTTRHPDLRGWLADAALTTLALWTGDGALLLLDAADGAEVARFHLTAPPVQVALDPAAQWLCCALPPHNTAWVFA